MDSESPVAPKGDGSTKYAIIGLLLLLGGGGAIYALTRSSEPPPARPLAAVIDAGTPQLPIAAPQVGNQIELPTEEPDAGPPQDAAANAAPRIRYVTRYVSACPGTIDVGQVQRVAQINIGALRACYNRELRTNNALRGPLTAQLKINTAGRVEDVEVSTPMRSPTMIQCMKAALRRLSVPAARGGCALVPLRFNFTPSN